jgi:hypothetical protein
MIPGTYELAVEKTGERIGLSRKVCSVTLDVSLKGLWLPNALDRV